MYLLVSPLYRSQHPLARIVSLLLGLMLLGLLLFFGLLAAGVLLVGGCVLLAWRYWTRWRTRTLRPDSSHKPQPQVLDGEFVVVQRERTNRH